VAQSPLSQLLGRGGAPGPRRGHLGKLDRDGFLRGIVEEKEAGGQEEEKPGWGSESLKSQ